MRKAIRGFVRRDRRQDDFATASSEPQPDRIQHVADAPAVAEPSVQEPAAQRTEPNAANPRSPAVSAPEDPASVSEDLWARAYQTLSEREPELVKDYEKHVEAVDGGGSGVLANPESVRALVKSLQDRREKAQWKFSVRSKDRKVSDQFEKLVKLLALADGVVKQSLSSQPYAALAWSTVSVFIPLLSGGFANNVAMVKGFTTIGDLQGYWRNYENVCLRSISSEHYKNLLEPLSNVYSYMLEYQVRAVCHLSEKQLSRAWQKVAGSSDWSGKEAYIVKLSDRCVANIAPLQREEMLQTLAAHNKTLEQIGNTENSILKTMKDDRQKNAEMEFLRALHSAAGNYKGGMEFNPDSVKGTCEWFFADETFSTWRDASDSGVFWLTAGPGCGKSNTTTTINTGSSTITNSVATVCYFFFKDDDVQRTKTTTALSALLHQLFCHESTSDLIEHPLPAFERSGGSLTIGFEDLRGALVTCADKTTCGDIICVLDALDECNKQDRDQLIRKLDSFYDDGPSAARTNLKFLITSRAYGDIERSFRPMSKRTEYFRFDADERHTEISHDIGLVIDVEMKSFASEFNDADREKIADTLKSKGTKTYLWLHLTMRIMKTDPSQYSRRRDVDALLAEVPTQVSDAYEKILNKTTNERITSTLLRIVLAAVRPLSVEEANYAPTLALENDGFETHAELEAGCWKTGLGTVVKNFSGFILGIYDDRLSFIHLTAQEYLVQKTEPGSPDTKWGGRFADASFSHALMSGCCIKYLILPELASRLLPLLSTREYPLLEYAARHWAKHFERQYAFAKQCWMQRARRLCKTSEQPLKIWGAVYCQVWAQQTFFGWTDLAVAAYLGLSTVVGKMLDDEAVDVNEYSAKYGSALNASIHARENVVAKLLISRGADVNANVCSSAVLPPLLTAAMTHNKDVLSLLLMNGASPLQRFTSHCENTTTVLQSVAKEGLADHFYTLVSTLVDISTPDKVLEALTNETIVHCGRKATALLFNLLPDEKQGDERFLNQDMLQTLLSHDSTRNRALQLIVEKKRQGILLEPPLFPSALRQQDSRKIVRNALQELDAPCANITQDVLKDFFWYGDAETLKTLLQYCPEDVCETGRLMREAIRNRRASDAVCEVVMDIVGESLYRNEQLQDELLDREDDPGIIPAFLRLPRCTVQVARRLVRILLIAWDDDFESNPKERKRMMAQILDHCTDKSSVIDANLLADGAEYCDGETFLWLMELSDGILTVMETLMQGDDAVQFITPRLVLAAADMCSDTLEWLLGKHAGTMATTVEPSPSVGNLGASEVAELAVAALRIAVEDTGNLDWAILRLLPYCADSLARPSESFILDLLEAAGGHDECLDYLAKDGLIVGEEWYRLARFRQMVAMRPPLEDIDALMELWAEGDIPDEADANGRTALYAAATTGNTVAIPFLVEVAKVSVDAVDRRGRTALHHAVSSDSYTAHEAVAALLLAGADPHKADYRGRTPMTLAQGRIAPRTREYSKIDAQKVLAVLNGDGQVEVGEVNEVDI
ncbi:Ankyrin repeat-containing domain protein [Akanthomyces lecanii RCEF 1005]|uniref:Ankyrin repeat-containing domain protein n=1 Tax=Akanthomyces lecanii RCEF 1005 TaxID=1081108 RepID=A0A168HAU7_CORDF|nr:Ankyrin repeat-containing domain protein [Akanthomyces lecanii RCEF 1005]